MPADPMNDRRALAHGLVRRNCIRHQYHRAEGPNSVLTPTTWPFPRVTAWPASRVMPEKTYTDREIAAIIEQAARIQQTAPEGRAGSGGLTLAELQEVGAAAGIAPAFVAEAAAAVEVGGTGVEKRPGRLVVRRTRKLAAPVGEEQWATMIAALRRRFGQTGVVHEVGDLREWVSGDGDEPVRVTLEPQGAAARLVIEQRTVHVSAKTSLLLALPAALFALIPYMNDDPKVGVGFLMLAAVLAAVGIGADVVGRRTARRNAVEHAALLDELVTLAGPGGATVAAAPPASVEEVQRALEMDLEEPPEPISGGPARRSTRA